MTDAEAFGQIVRLCEHITPCDDADVMRIWREVGLPEYFLGNGGTNFKLVAFARRIRETAGGQ